MATESASTSGVFTTAQYALLTSILNRLIPASDDFPGAGDLGVASYLDTVVGPVAELKRLFTQGLGQITIISQAQYAQEFPGLTVAQQDTVLRQVEAHHAEFFAALVCHTYSGFYSHPTVLQLLGLEVRPPQPRGYHLAPFDLRLLERVKQREPLYRQA